MVVVNANQITSQQGGRLEKKFIGRISLDGKDDGTAQMRWIGVVPRIVLRFVKDITQTLHVMIFIHREWQWHDKGCERFGQGIVVDNGSIGVCFFVGHSFEIIGFIPNIVLRFVVVRWFVVHFVTISSTSSGGGLLERLGSCGRSGSRRTLGGIFGALLLLGGWCFRLTTSCCGSLLLFGS